MKTTFRGLCTALGAVLVLAGAQAKADVLFWSTQAKPVEETQAMRSEVLKGFDGKVNYQANDPGPWLTRVQAEMKAGKGSIQVLGGLHGDFTSLSDGLMDLSKIDLGGVKVNPSFMKLGKLGSKEQKYIPWMQATYIMVANKKALPYLPTGADINALTYDQLIAWAKNLDEKTGSPKFGLPAGPKGLLHRFLQGYLYPSYTGSMVTKFRSPEAVTAWQKLKDLWKYTNPASTGYAFMQEPLLSGAVWVAFDHTARLADALNKRPNDFVAFPAPAGPAGRGFMPVIAGLAIPKTAPDKAAAEKLIKYMLQPSTQIATLRATSFFPVIDVNLPNDMPPSVKASGAAIAKMSGAKDALPALLPMGLGDLGGKFNQVYIDTFQRIILGGQPIKRVLDDEAGTLRALMKKADAPCWAPDAPSKGACPVN
ncbi:ABC transporter substrate-binding protein [Solirhodobacter olei]|uniref:ABC transporter substrate-binding protein n=1 Tax=Solirhodobacter olei TaxID=2493082 RepID=UPI000FDC212E|nr:ABC transporter substrate-binding protein [Solirhodobacter olei]